MEHLYVDESGSMSKEFASEFPYFIICTVRVKDTKKLKRVYKRFISKYHNDLKIMDDGKMFDADRFKELKGSSLNYEMKKTFVEYFSRPDLFEVYYIKVTNEKIKPVLYENTARAFNYLYKLNLQCFLKNNFLPKDNYIIHFDNRNQKNDSKNSLEDYLNIELHLSDELSEGIQVHYYNSEQNCFIQIADVFSNLYYSYCFHPQRYKLLIKKIKEEKIFKGIIEFPCSTT